MTPITTAVQSCLSESDYYDLHAEEYFGATVGVDMGSVYERFLKKLSPGAHIADAGCGSGRDTRAFLQKGYVVTAFDSSPEMVRLAAAYTGQNCIVVRFQDMNFREEFDAVWACASLLHVPRREMPDVLRRFVTALRPGGVMYASFVEGGEDRAGADGRLYTCYTPEALTELIRTIPGTREVACWRSEEIASSAKRSPWLNLLFKKNAQIIEDTP